MFDLSRRLLAQMTAEQATICSTELVEGIIGVDLFSYLMINRIYLSMNFNGTTYENPI
jgi:hypothetical protein